MAKKRSKLNLSDQLRGLIEDSGKSRYEIAKATGVDQAVLSRFMHGKGGLSMPVLDSLAEYLGWTVTIQNEIDKLKGR